MIQALGKFTVTWERRGPIYYACWFTRSSDYYKCAKGLKSIEVATHNKDEHGVVTSGEYFFFGPFGTLDKTTQEKFSGLSKPFFISQFLAHKTGSLRKKIYQEPKFQQTRNDLKEEHFIIFPETEKENSD